MSPVGDKLHPPLNQPLAVSLSRTPYPAALELQRSLHARVREGELPGVLLLLEHPHVYTLGRRGRPADILATPEELARLGVEVQHTDRGGEVTYHGPGQLVGYPIVDLRRWGGGPLSYVQALEEVLVATLAEFGIHGEVADRPTGVWVGDAKIAAIGVRVSRGVTMHGFALNVDPDLSYFDHIVPCGMREGAVTSMSALGAVDADLGAVMHAVASHFGAVFGWDIGWSTVDALPQAQPPRTPVLSV